MMEEEKYECPECKKECLESELLEDDYAQYKGFSEELFCPHCKARVD
jgi:DNA-directed RNA polymerase subunit RPC12/RpoP